MSNYKVGDIVYVQLGVTVWGAGEILEINDDIIRLQVNIDGEYCFEEVKAHDLGVVFFNVAETEMYKSLKTRFDKADTFIYSLKEQLLADACKENFTNALKQQQ
jgi:hypothetical protein